MLIHELADACGGFERYSVQLYFKIKHIGDKSTMNTFHTMISDRNLAPTSDIQTLAVDIAREIQDEQYDGYSGYKQQLASAIAFTLACMATRYNWSVHASTDIDHNGPLYKVWIQRKK